MKNIETILETLYQGNTLNQNQCEKLLHSIIKNQLSPVQISAALISMKIREENIEEIIGATNALLTHSQSFSRPNILFADITGTGGDRKNTINISTASALVASACNTKIIKHGNFQISSTTGSMDLLNLNYTYTKNYEKQALENFNKFGICFLCASQYYTVFRNIMNIRKQLKTPTLFNIIGPLINPAKPILTLIGVYKEKLLLPMIQALKLLKYQHAIVVHCDGIDEVGLHAPTHVLELLNNRINNYILTASDFGLNSYPLKDLYCDSKQTAYKHIVNLLQGKGKPAHTAVIAANVSLFLKLFGYNDLKSNTALALDKIYQGVSYEKFLSLSNRT